MLATLMLPVTTLLDLISTHVTPDTAVMDRPVLMMNDCVSGDNICHATFASCTNTDGSYQCAGNEG